MGRLDKFGPMYAPSADEGREENAPEKPTQEVRSPEQLANDVLNFLADRLGAAEWYYEEGVSDEEIAEELYERFGAYDSDVVYEHCQRMMESPSAIGHPVLKELAEKDESGFSSKFEHSRICKVLRCTDTAWVPIRRRAAELEAISDLEIKKKRLGEIRDEIRELIQGREYIIRESGGGEPLELRHLERLRFPPVSSSRGHSLSLDDVAGALQRASFDVKFRETIGAFDKSKLAEETLKYGAKGANLNQLKSIQTAVSEILGIGNFEIPDYRLIPASVYEKQQYDQYILSEVRDVFDWINGRKVIIRSSAVYSEDAESATGAGVYESVILEEGASLRDFLTKVKQVYKSVDKPAARQYREEHGIAEEKMGLVVQEFVERPPSGRGYANSIVKNVPKLMEIAYEDGLRSIAVKDLIMKAIVHHDVLDTSFMHYEIDRRRKNPLQVGDIARIIALVEKHYGAPIQVEFLQAEGKPTSLVQARFLPRSFSEKRHIKFPEGKAVFEGRAVGAFDLILPVLSNEADNRDKEGIVIFHSSERYTFKHEAAYALPRSGGVIVLGTPSEGGGHIETICAEKGLALVFSDEMPKRGSSTQESSDASARLLFGVRKNVAAKIDRFGGYTTLRMVADGLKGKVYGVGEKEEE